MVRRSGKSSIDIFWFDLNVVDIDFNIILQSKIIVNKIDVVLYLLELGK
jgi:hypothetical protein